MLPNVVLIDVTISSFKIHIFFYSDLSHTNSQFMTLRSRLKDLSNNCSQLDVATSLDHWMFNMHIGSS